MATQPDRRSAFRSPLPPNQRNGTLVRGKEAIPVSVVNESATGFLVAADHLNEMNVGEVLRFQVGDRRLEVRVARFGRDGSRTRIGLELVRELSYDERGTTFDITDSNRIPVARRKGTWLAIATLGMLAALTVVFAYQQYVGPSKSNESDKQALPAYNGMSDELRARLRQGPDVVNLLNDEMVRILDLTSAQQGAIGALASGDSKDDAQTLFNHAVELLRVDQQLRLHTILDAASSPLTKLNQYASRWPTADSAELYRRLGMGALALPRVADSLEFTTEQRRQLPALVEKALEDAEALKREAEVDRRGNRAKLLVEANSRLEQARDQALKLLTDSQRKRLGILSK
ncbi:MAG: hypothetical protein JSS27_06935 [Planctomycetes bacterium]|nr:hypothetical protein [Planctomycetota bacterium]